MDKKEINKCWVIWVKTGYNGIAIYLCFHQDFMGPVGFVWGISIYNQNKEGMFHVLGSYVLKNYRRIGVRTLINKTILTHNKIIHSWYGTKTGGKAFMINSGYTFDKIRHDWFLIKGKKNGKRKTIRS